MNPLNATTHLHVSYANDKLEELYETLDELHTAVTEGETQHFTTLNDQEIAGLLRDLIFTAQETLKELEKRQQPKKKRNTATILQFVQPEHAETLNA